MRQQGLHSQEKAQGGTSQHVPPSEVGLQRGWSQAPVSDALRQDKREWAQSELVRFHQCTRTDFYCEADWELHQAAQGGRMSFLGDLDIFWPTNPTWDGWSRGLGHDFQRSPPNLNQPLVL